MRAPTTHHTHHTQSRFGPKSVGPSGWPMSAMTGEGGRRVGGRGVMISSFSFLCLILGQKKSILQGVDHFGSVFPSPDFPVSVFQCMFVFSFHFSFFVFFQFSITLHFLLSHSLSFLFSSFPTSTSSLLPCGLHKSIYSPQTSVQNEARS